MLLQSLSTNNIEHRMLNIEHRRGHHLPTFLHHNFTTHNHEIPNPPKHSSATFYSTFL